MLLTAVTTRHVAPCTDSIVFTFASSVSSPPGVQVSLVTPPFTGVDGRPRPVRGERFYRVQFEPASTFDFQTGKPSYTGSTDFTFIGAAHIVQIVETDAFEGVVTWIIGVHSGDQFVAVTTSSPPSLALTF